MFIAVIALVTPFIACAMASLDLSVCSLRDTAWILARISMNFLTYRLVLTKSLAIILTASCHYSGKTVIADYFQTLGYTSVSVDDFLSHNGEYTFDSDDYKKSKVSCHNRTENLLRIKRDVVVHNTFRTLNEIKPYLDLYWCC